MTPPLLSSKRAVFGQIDTNREPYYVSDYGQVCGGKEVAVPDSDHFDVTEAMVERGGRALYRQWLEHTTYFRSYDEVREGFERDARLVLAVALDEERAR